MKFSEKIVQLRKDNNLTQTELAKKTFCIKASSKSLGKR